MKPGLEPPALGFLNLEPGPSPLKARAKPCLGPGRAWLRALSPARPRHITNPENAKRLWQKRANTTEVIEIPGESNVTNARHPCP